MTDYYDYGDDPGPGDDGGGGGNLVNAMLRREARAGEKARGEVATLRRELALTRAGVPDDTPLGKLFRSTFDGSDAEVAEAWAEVAPPPAPVIDPADVVLPELVQDPGERASTQERSELASGGGDYRASAWSPDPRDLALAMGRKIVSDGGTADDALAAHFDVLARAASQNDRRVRIK